MKVHIRQKSLIRIAYKLLLGREPESDFAINAKMGFSISELRDLFIKSYEFKIIHRDILTPDTFPIPATKLSNTQANDEYRSIVNQWRILGEQNPYWSVLSSDEYLTDISDSQKEMFF